MENTVKDLKKLIYSFGAEYKPTDIFRDFVELAALAIFNSYIPAKNTKKPPRRKFSTISFTAYWVKTKSVPCRWASKCRTTTNTSHCGWYAWPHKVALA